MRADQRPQDLQFAISVVVTSAQAGEGGAYAGTVLVLRRRGI
jgi:hypothetical protein